MTKKILVVDDSSTIRLQVSFTLKKVGYEVIAACDGVEGLDKVTSDDQINMIILDMNMPNMGGMEFLQRLKDTERKGIPILVLTTEGENSIIESAMKLGAKVWMTKPFKPDLLTAAVGKLCPLQ